MASALPKWVRYTWLCMAPLGLSLAIRIAWEKTVWTWSYGPQMVGFSLVHLHPLFFLVGFLCCYGICLWLIGVVIYLGAKRPHPISGIDVTMCLLSTFVLLALITPNYFFSRLHH